MAIIRDYKQFSKDYLEEIYQYEGKLDFDFFKTRVWWWRLTETFIDNYKQDKGPFIDWVNRIVSNLSEEGLYEECEEEFFDDDGEIFTTETFREPINWIKKYYLLLYLFNKNITHFIIDAFKYELKARFNGEYELGENWFELQATKQSLGDINSLDSYFFNEAFTDIEPKVKASDLEINLKAPLETSKRELANWIKEKREKFGISPAVSYVRNLNAWKSMQVLEWIDIKHFDLRVLTETEERRIRQVRQDYKEGKI